MLQVDQNCDRKECTRFLRLEGKHVLPAQMEEPSCTMRFVAGGWQCRCGQVLLYVLMPAHCA